MISDQKIKWIIISISAFLITVILCIFGGIFIYVVVYKADRTNPDSESIEQQINPAEQKFQTGQSLLAKNPKAAYKWFIEAAELNHPEAMELVFKAYEDDDKIDGIPINYHKSFAILKGKADRGNLQAMYKIINYYKNGIGTEIDFYTAEKYCGKMVRTENDINGHFTYFSTFKFTELWKLKKMDFYESRSSTKVHLMKNKYYNDSNDLDTQESLAPIHTNISREDAKIKYAKKKDELKKAYLDSLLKLIKDDKKIGLYENIYAAKSILNNEKSTKKYYEDLNKKLKELTEKVKAENPC